MSGKVPLRESALTELGAEFFSGGFLETQQGVAIAMCSAQVTPPQFYRCASHGANTLHSLSPLMPP